MKSEIVINEDEMKTGQALVERGSRELLRVTPVSIEERSRLYKKFLLDMEQRRYGWPTCAKCKKSYPLTYQRFTSLVRDELIIRVGYKLETDTLILNAVCHGEIEVIRIPFQQVINLEEIDLNGEAFKGDNPTYNDGPMFKNMVIE